MGGSRFQIVIEAITKNINEAGEEIRRQLGGGMTDAADGADDLSSRLKALNRQADDTNNQLKQVDSFRHLKRDTESLRGEWQAAEGRLKELAHQMRETDRPTKAMQTEFNRAQKQAAGLKDEVQKNEVSLHEMRKEMSAAGIDTGKLSTEKQRLQAQLSNTQKEVTALGSRFGEAQQPTATFFTRAGAGMTAFSTHLRENQQRGIDWSRHLRTAFATVAGTAGIGYLITRQLDLADAIVKTADSVGITTDSLQEYRFMAERSGVSTSQLDSGLQAFVQRLGEARQGQGTLNTYLSKTNDALLDQMRAAGSTDKALNLFMEALAGTEDAADKAAMANAAFGRSAGSDMVNIVKGGTDAVQDLREQYKRLGISIDQDLLDQSVKAKDVLTDLKAVISAGVTRAVVSLAPEIAKAAENFIEWIQANDGLTESLADLFKWIGSIIATVGKFLAEYGKWVIVSGAVLIATKKIVLYLGAFNQALLAITGQGFVVWARSFVAALKTIELGFATAGAKATLFWGAATLGVGYAITKLIELTSVIFESRDAWAAAGKAAERAQNQIDKVKEKYEEFKDVKLPDNIMELARKDLEEFNDQLHKARAYYRVLRLELEDKMRDLGSQVLTQRVQKELDATAAELAKVDERLKEIKESIKDVDEASEAANKKAQESAEALAKKLTELRKKAHEEELERMGKRTAVQSAEAAAQLAAIDLALAKREISEREAAEKRMAIARADAEAQLAQVEKLLKQEIDLHGEHNEERAEVREKLQADLINAETALTRVVADEYRHQTRYAEDSAKDQVAAEKEAAVSQVEIVKDKFAQMREIIEAENKLKEAEFERDLADIEYKEQEGILSHLEATQAKADASENLARFQLAQAQKAVSGAIEHYGEMSAEHQIATAEMAAAAENLKRVQIDGAAAVERAERKKQKLILATYISNFDRISGAYKDLLDEIENMASQYSGGGGLGRIIKWQVSETLAHLREVKSALEDVQDYIENRWNISFDAANLSLENALETIIQIDDAFAAAGARIDTARDGVADIKDDIAAWRDGIDGVVPGVDDVKTKIEALEESVGRLFSRKNLNPEEIEAALEDIATGYEDLVATGRSVISQLMSQWDELEGKIRGVEEQIAEIHRQTADTIRGLERSLMDDESAWLDMRLEAREKFAQAVREMEAGNVEAANRLFEESRRIAQGLAKELRNANGEVIKSQEETTQLAVSLIEEITDVQEKALNKYGDGLTAQQRALQGHINQTTDLLSGAEAQVAKVGEQARLTAQEIREIWDNIPSHMKSVTSLSKPPKFATGGYIGGKPHSQGGTIIEAERGEYIQPSAVVKKYGLKFMSALRDQVIPKDWVTLMMTGGRPLYGDNGIITQSLIAAEQRFSQVEADRPLKKFSAGGLVGGGSGSSSSFGSGPEVKVHKVEFSFGGSTVATGAFSEDDAEALIEIFRDAKLRAN